MKKTKQIGEEKGIDYSKDNVFDAIGRPDLKPKEKKDRLFQYATEIGCFAKGYSFSLDTKFYEDTELITEEEVNNLWDKYYPQVAKDLEDGNRPQMCIWKDCNSNSSYYTVEREINYQDNLEVNNGKIYKLSKTEL